jgi:hypothetical protein
MTNKINVADEFIDQLLLKYRISLRAVYDFAEEHMEELQQAKKIFDLKDERDKKLCLALFRLLSEKNAAAISTSFCGRYHIADSSLDDLFFEQNKIFLIAAFIYNPSFFARSCNLCGILMSQLAFKAELLGEKQKPGKSKAFEFPRTIPALAASGTDETLEEIWGEDIDQDGIQGKLRILAYNKDDAGVVQFRFKFGEYYPEPPYYLRVRYTTNSDGMEYTAELNIIAVNSSKNRELVIDSAPQKGIRYSDGLSIISLEVHNNG